MTVFGADVSEHQDGMSLVKAKAEGIDFVIIRLCDGTYKDRCFRSHLDDAEKAGLLVSTYWYLRAPSEGTTIAEQVNTVCEQLQGRKDIPIWIDVESVDRAGAKLLTGDHVHAAKSELESRGLRVAGVYSGAWYWENMPGGEPSMNGLGALWVSNYGPNTTGGYREIYPGDNSSRWLYPLGDKRPDLLQYGSNGLLAGHTVDVNAFRGSVDDLKKLLGYSNTHAEVESMAPIERVLDYPRDQVTQDTFYNCGPASTQTIIRAATGALIGEAQLAREMGTTVNGTDHIGLLANALNRHVPGGDYKVVTIPNDPPSREQVNALWENLTGSINAGHGVAANIIAPPSNYPRPSYVASQALNYGGGTVYHYIALMGYAVDSRGARHVWWADSGFAPYGCWVTLEQTASLIAGKGYAFSNAPSKEMETNNMSESIMRDNQIQLRGPELAGWEVNSLVKAMAKRDGDRGTMAEIMATDLTVSRDNQTQLRGPGLEGWDIKQLVEVANKRSGRATMAEMMAVCLQEIKALRAEVQALKGA